MILYLLYFLSSLTTGLMLTEVLKIHLSTVFKLASSLTIGMVINLLALFFMSWIFGLTFISAFLTTAVLLAISTVFLKKTNFSLDFREIKYERNLKIVVPLLLLALIVVLIFYKSIFVTDTQISTGNRLVWGDWPVHISFISSFAKGNNFPPQNPLHAGSLTTYPFVIEFQSAVLQTLGATLKSSLVMPGIILSLTIISLLYTFGKTFFEKSTLTVVGIFVGLFSGGLGFLYFTTDLLNSPSFFITLLNPPKEYTFYAEKNLWFFTFLYSEFIPQRAFLLGMPIFFTSVILLVLGLVKSSKPKVLLSAYLIGLLPFVHMHSYISAIIFSSTFILLNFFDVLKKWDFSAAKSYVMTVFIYFFLPILSLALIQLPNFINVGGQSFAYNFGWQKGDENFVIFWIKNTGVFWPLLVLGYFQIKNKVTKNIILSSVPLFILPNLFRFALWPYDNLKILTYWYLIGAFAVSVALISIWRKGYLGKTTAAVLFLSLTLSGAVDIVGVLNTKNDKINIWSKEDMEIANAITQNTEPESVILAAATHDHPITSLAGRKIVIGYPGQSWSWGLHDWQQRENDVKRMLEGDSTVSQSLIKKYNISYVLISPKERNFDRMTNEPFFQQNYETVAIGPNYKLFKVK